MTTSLLPTLSLAGRSALVTGSTSGIGRSIALTLAAAGAHIVVSGRDAGRGAEVVDAIRESGGTAEFVAADLNAPSDELRAFAGSAVDAAGGRLDILVNNAGIYPVTSTEGLADVDLDAMLAVNIRAPHVLVATLAPLMADRAEGAIVNLGSWMARTGSGFGAMYTATKAADEQLTRAWASEYGPRGVRVNTLAPGATATEGNADSRDILDAMSANLPGRGVVLPQDIAWGVLFLVSDAARMVHGVTLDVDGGMSATRL